LARILADRGKEPLYKRITQAKSLRDLCDALDVEYREKLGDSPSRGASSVVVKAADRIPPYRAYLILANETPRVEVKKNNVHRVKDSPSKGFVAGTPGFNGNALTA